MLWRCCNESRYVLNAPPRPAGEGICRPHEGARSCECFALLAPVSDWDRKLHHRARAMAGESHVGGDRRRDKTPEAEGRNLSCGLGSTVWEPAAPWRHCHTSALYAAWT